MILPVKILNLLDDPAAEPLLSAYSVESSVFEIGVARPSREMYAALEASGSYQAFAAFDDDVLVGFAAVIVYPLPHYSGSLVGSNESIYLLEQYRKTSLGRDLKAALRSCAKELGAVSFIWTAPAESGFDHSLSASDTCRHTHNSYVEKL